MEQSSWILILVAVAVLMQAAAMVGILIAMHRIRTQVEGVRADIKQRLEPLAQSALEIMNNSREPIRTALTNLAEISKMMRDRAHNMDALAAEIVDRTRLQIIRIDQMVADMVDKFEKTADAVQHGVMGPIREFTAAMKGIRAGWEYLFSKRRVVDVPQATQDEELFI